MLHHEQLRKKGDSRSILYQFPYGDRGGIDNIFIVKVLPELQNWRKYAVKRLFDDLLSGRDFTSGAGYGYIKCREVQFCGAIGKIKPWHKIDTG